MSKSQAKTSSAPYYKLINIEQYKPRESNPNIAKLLPNTVIPFRATFEFHNVNSAIANGVRRVILSEYPVKVLDFGFDSFSTNDPYVLIDFVLGRVRCIPLMQTCPDDATFKLKFKNNTQARCDVKSSQIVNAKTGEPIKYVNGTFTVCSLEPGNEISIVMNVVSGYGLNGGWFSIASSAVSLPMVSKDKPVLYDGFNQNISNDERAMHGTSVSNFTSFQLSYIGCGTVNHETIYKTAIAEIIKRLEQIEQFIPGGTNVDNVFILSIPKETYTIGYLLETEILILYPNIAGITCKQEDMTKTIYLTIRDPMAETKIREAIKSIISKYKALI